MLYSLPRGEQIVTALLARGATVVFRPHPFNYDFGEDAATIARIQALLAEDAEAAARSTAGAPRGYAALGRRRAAQVLVVGRGMVSLSIAVALACVWPILLNTMYGVRGVDPTAVNTARTLGLTRNGTKCGGAANGKH